MDRREEPTAELNDCQRICDNEENCVGIEYDTGNTNIHCYILTGKGFNFRSTANTGDCPSAPWMGTYTCYRKVPSFGK